MNIRRIVKARLKSKGKTQYWLAKELGISRQRVSAYLGGRNDVNGETLGRMLELLDLTIKPKG